MGLEVPLEVILCLPGRDCGVGVGQAARSLITRPRATVVLGGCGGAQVRRKAYNRTSSGRKQYLVIENWRERHRDREGSSLE